MPFRRQIISYSIKANALFLCLVMVHGCSQKMTDPKDIGILHDACESIKSKSGQTTCLDSLAKVAGKEFIDAIPKKPDPGIAKEEITFKGIPLDQPNQLESLMALCAATKDNLEQTRFGFKLNNRCKRDPDGNSSFQVDYGSMNRVNMLFNTDGAGSLTKAFKTLERGEAFPLVAALTKKYGPPKIEEDELQNGFGNKFDRQIFSWFDMKGNSITIHSRYGKVDEGRFEIQSASEILKDAKKTIETISAAKERL